MDALDTFLDSDKPWDKVQEASVLSYQPPVDSGESDYDDIISEASELHGVEPGLIRSVIKAESDFKPDAVSGAGAGGLMQLMPGTAQEMGVSDITNPRENIMAGTKYLARQLKTSGGDIPLALAAYNAGPGNVKKYGGIPPFEETQEYISKVTKNYEGYKKSSRKEERLEPDPFDTFLDSDIPWANVQKEAPKSYGVTGTWEDKYNITGGIKDIGKLFYDIPVNVMGATASMFEDDNPEAEYDWKDIARKAQEERNKMRMAEEGGEEYVLPWVQRKDIRQAGASAGFSGVAMGAAVVGGAAAIPIPVPGARVAASLAASGTAAYRMDKAMFTQQVIDAARQHEPDITPDKVAQIVEDTKDIRCKHALWEAIPEAAGNIAQLTGIGALFKAALGKKLGAKIFQTLAGMYGVEIGTEVITQMGQHDAEIEAGITKGEKRSFTSLDDLQESFKEVGPQTFVLVSLTGGAGAVGAKTYQVSTVKLKGIKDITKKAVPKPETDVTSPSIDKIRTKFESGEHTAEDLEAIKEIWSDDAELSSAIDDILKPKAEPIKPTGAAYEAQKKRQDKLSKEFAQYEKEIAEAKGEEASQDRFDEIRLSSEQRQKIIEDEFKGEIEAQKQDEKVEAEISRLKARKAERAKETEERRRGVKPEKVEDIQPEVPVDQRKEEDRRKEGRKGPERRKAERRDVATRKAIDELSPEEKGFAVPELRRMLETQKKAALRQERIANSDPLTGLKNRRGLEKETARREREGKESYHTFIDLIGFKGLNDYISHEAGDATLKFIANAMKSVDLESPTRWGGDELMFQAESVEAGEADAQKLHDYFEKNPLRLRDKEGKEYDLTVMFRHGTAKSIEKADEIAEAAKETEPDEWKRGKAHPGLQEISVKPEKVVEKKKAIDTGESLAKEFDLRYMGEADGLEYYSMKHPKGETTIATKGVDRAQLLKKIEHTKKTFGMEAKTTVHDYSNTQVNLPKESAKTIKDFGRKIPDEELYTEPKDDSYGREKEPHITIRYGLETSDPKDVEPAFKDVGPIKVKFGKISIFESDNYDVIKVDVESPDLLEANKKVGETVKLPGETFKDYKPHATIAYVKKGEGKKYVGDKSLEGQEAIIDSIFLSAKDGKMHEIKLKAAPVPEKTDVALEGAGVAKKKPKEPVKAKPKKEDKRIAQFHKFADSLQKQIDEKRSPAISQQNLTARRARIAAGMAKDADLLEETQNILIGIADAIENDTLPESLKGIRNKAQIETLNLARKYDWKLTGLDEAENKRIMAAGLDDPQLYEQAKKDIGKYIKGPSEETIKKQELKKLERGLIGTKIPGFFPTPKPVINRMLEDASIRPDMKVLEPSAGKGDIADVIREKHPEADLDIIEYSGTLTSILEAKGYEISGKNFLEYEGNNYDRIIMNPPFEKGQDIDHVRHAYDILKPGGRLVSIVSEGPFFRTDKKAIAFREWLEKVDASDEKLEQGSFKGAESFRQTGIAARIVVVEKPSQDLLYSFAGAKARIADKSMLGKASQMEFQGKDMEAIRKETGWMLDVDNKWKFEIDDSAVRIRDKGKGEWTTLGDAIKHTKLFQAYPELKDVELKLTIDEDLKAADGSLNAGPIGKYEVAGIGLEEKYSDWQIFVRAPNMEDAKSVLLHEIQHAIQEIEGFAIGGAEETFKPKGISGLLSSESIIYNNLFEDKINLEGYISRKWLDESTEIISKKDFIEKHKKDKGIARALSELKDIERKMKKAPKTAFEAYKRLAGEVEARETSLRKNLTPEQRRIVPPYLDGIPREDVIVRFDRDRAQYQEETVLPYLQGMTNFPTVRVVQSIDQLPKQLKAKVTAFSKRSNKQVEGFYDKEGDQVFLIADNLSEDRIEAVLRHEAEGHRGIRLLLGSDLDGFLDQVAKAKEKDLLGHDPGLNFKDQAAVRVAADEWLARKIEAGNLSKSFWDDLIRIFRKWLRKFVPNLDLTDREIRSVLVDTVKNVREGRIDRIRKGEGMPLYSIKQELTAKQLTLLERHYPEKLEAFEKKFKRKSGGTISKESRDGSKAFVKMGEIPSSPEGFNMPHEGKGGQVFDLLQFKIQDRLNSLRKVQKIIEKQKATEIPDDTNAYQTEELYHGKVARRVGEFDTNHLDPLMDLIHESGLDLEDVEEFLYARHAPEANKRLQDINPKREDNKALSGMSNEEAETIMARYANNKAMIDIAAQIDVITKKTRQILVDEGLATPEEIAAWENTYKYYVPLKREGKTIAMPKKGKGMDIGGAESKKRLVGSAERKAVNILTNIIAQHESAIIRAEKAKVGRAMLKLAEAHPNKELWEVDAPELKPFLKQRKSEEIDEITGLPTTLSEVVYGKDILYKFNDNVLVVKVDGKEHTITFNDQNVHAQRMARSLKNLGADNSNAVINTLSAVNRLLAIVNTSANPEFIISNFTRDIQTAGYNINDTEAKNVKIKIFKDVFKALQGIRRGIREDYSSEWAKNFKDFAKAGAQTGWTDHYKNIEAREKSLKKKLDLLKDGKWSSAQRAARGLFEFVSNENTAVENAIRLSTYTHLKRIGLSDAKAASAAKNLTVNFNRRGDMGQALNALYLFFNANVQGSARLIYAAVRSPRVRRMMYGTVAFAVMLDILNRAIGGDDDDGEKKYDKIPSWVKEHNLVLMRSNGDYFKLPLPWGYNTLHVLGQSIGEAIDPNKDEFSAMAAAGRLGSAIVGSFNPLGSESTILQLAAPTIADPFVQWAENQNFAGIPIKPEQLPFDVPKPEYQMYWQNSRKPTRWITKKFNDLTGGDEVKPGLIDVSPEVVDLFVDTFSGGAGRFIDNTIKLPGTLTKKDIDVRRIPFIRKVYGESPDYYLRTKFYDNLGEIRYAEKSKRHYSDDKDKLVDVKKKYAWELRFVNRVKSDKSEIRSLRKKRRMFENQKELSKRDKEKKVEEIEKKVSKIMTDFNRTYKGRKDQKRAVLPLVSKPVVSVTNKPLTLREAMRLQ